MGGLPDNDVGREPQTAITVVAFTHTVLHKCTGTTTPFLYTCKCTCTQARTAALNAAPNHARAHLPTYAYDGARPHLHTCSHANIDA